MSTEYRPLSRSAFTADDFARNEEAFDAPREQTLHADEALIHAEEQPMFAGTPIYARTTRKKTANRMTPALMIGVPAVVLLAGVTYFAMQPRQTIMADPIPATAVIEAPVTNPAAPVAAELAAAQTPQPTTPEAVVATRPAARAAPPVRVAAARPAPAAQAASGFAADASATLPSAPVPYSALGQTSAPAPAAIVAPPPVAAPAEAASAPAEQTPAPVVSEPAVTPPTETPETITP